MKRNHIIRFKETAPFPFYNIILKINICEHDGVLTSFDLNWNGIFGKRK